MGNYINPSPGSATFFLNPIIPTCESLTMWKKYAILNFHQNYLSLYPLSIYLTQPEFSRVVQQSSISVQSDLIFSTFNYPSFRTLNMLELLAALIICSSADLEDRVSMAFKIFDFDHSKKISLDELNIICTSFIKALKILTGFNSEIQTEEKHFGSLFAQCETGSDKQISQPELEKWVKSNKVLLKLFSRKTFDDESQMKKASIIETLPRIKARRKSSLVESNQPWLLFMSPGLKEYSELFKSCCNRLQKAQASVLYNKMISIPKFRKHANDFYNTFHFKLKTELTLADFLMYFKNYTENPYEKSYKFVQTRRKGFSMDTPQGVIKSIVEDNESKERNNRRVLLNIFNKYDENRDGFVDLKELKTGLQEFVTGQGIEGLFCDYDEDKNNLLDFEEFLSMFKPSNKSFDASQRTRKSILSG